MFAKKRSAEFENHKYMPKIDFFFFLFSKPIPTHISMLFPAKNRPLIGLLVT